MWEVHYSLEAATYLEDNGQLIADLFFAMESLAESEGWPLSDFDESIEGFISWWVNGHMVVYERIELKKIARVISIKPD